MSACKQWREALLDHALGQPASASLQAHLALCELCSAALRKWSAGDGQIDVAVRHMVISDPAPSVPPQAPTGGLLNSPLENWRKSVPRLGETFFEFKPEMFRTEQENAKP